MPRGLGRDPRVEPASPRRRPSDVLRSGRELRVRLTGGRDLRLEVKPRPDEDAARPRAPHRPVAGPQRSSRGDRSRTPKRADRRRVLPHPVGAAGPGRPGPRPAQPSFRPIEPTAATGCTSPASSPLPIYDEGLWQVAAWFTGDGAHFVELQRVNGLASPELGTGSDRPHPGEPPRPRAPARADRPTTGPSCTEATRGAATPATGSSPARRSTPPSCSATPGARRRRTSKRWRGRSPREAASAISPTFPPGWLVKIPIDVLEPEFLPVRRAPRRASRRRKPRWSASSARGRRQAATHGLQGVVVILDPGHGGMDPGTMNHAVWEHDYVFDVASRLRRELEAHTGAKVVLTLDDPGKESVPSRGDALESNRKRSVLTTPPFLAEEDGETAVAVNLRWYLANSVYRRLVKSRRRSRQDRVPVAPRGRAPSVAARRDGLRAGRDAFAPARWATPRRPTCDSRRCASSRASVSPRATAFGRRRSRASWPRRSSRR